ncbi:hypothetical protein PVT71_04945 [Salipiger sp. H15]|uniref:Oxidoreductase molybdopterin-binding domain-containing protein n=1 Tax=Alloyangia sp. H15 TaxID=3029062 RepID=A0AAU8AHY9_9RHOB
MADAFQRPGHDHFRPLRPFRTAGCALALLGLLAGPALASEPLLTLHAADGRQAVLDRDALEALPQHEFSTETYWTWEEQRFSGPLLSDVLELAGLPGPASGGVIELVADDGYHSRIDLGEAAQYFAPTYPIIATRINGAPFPIEENGPLWVMFPYDAHPELNIEPVHHMTVWQLLEIVEKPE